MKIIVVYDNNIKKSDAVKDIIGDKYFGDVVIKKKVLEDYTRQIISDLYKDIVWKRVNSVFEYPDLINYLKRYDDNEVKILHIFANYFITDIKKVNLSLEKIFYTDKPYKIMYNKKNTGFMFDKVSIYISFCKSVINNGSDEEAKNEIKSEFIIEGLTDISNISDFVKCITGGFDSRYYNSLKEDEYTITKTSTDKLKIKKEYCFYGLLPEDMRFWFVMPFNYKETETTASYTMERLHMTDLAIKYVHGSIDENEFENLLDKYMFFFNSRHEKECSNDEYQKISDDLYVNKVNERIQKLKSLEQFKVIEKLLDCANANFDEIVGKYFELKEKIERKNKYPHISVIGHGDPGFANTLYNKATQTLKFIDPKGALTQDELWTNPYYDIAKLSHCVCGRYDFFNNNLFEIKLNEKFSYELEIPFNNEKYKKIFQNKLIKNNIDYSTIRIYEASLFLSMLPLHIDNPYKVLGFTLNVKNILEEIEENV